MTTAFSYLAKAGGLETEKDYPYTGKNSACKFDKSKIAAQVKNFSTVAVDEDQIAANLVKHGPLASKAFAYLIIASSTVTRLPGDNMGNCCC